MDIESRLGGLAADLSTLAERRRSQWLDAAGRDFESRYLRLLTEAVEEFRHAAADFAETADRAFSELGE